MWVCTQQPSLDNRTPWLNIVLCAPAVACCATIQAKQCCPPRCNSLSSSTQCPTRIPTVRQVDQSRNGERGGVKAVASLTACALHQPVCLCRRKRDTYTLQPACVHILGLVQKRGVPLSNGGSCPSRATKMTQDRTALREYLLATCCCKSYCQRPNVPQIPTLSFSKNRVSAATTRNKFAGTGDCLISVRLRACAA